VKITVLCVGKLGKTDEGRLALDYAARATAAGRAHGLGPVEIVEADEGVLLEKLDGGHVIACDEHGQARGSRDFAAHLGRLRDDGERRVIFVIGPADGLDSRVLATARERLAFGPQTWPHALARAMLAEQIYRAATLMAGSPYHRD
jgi:23S rRNA (pseudouridine1915-N3)-methyltransferase